MARTRRTKRQKPITMAERAAMEQAKAALARHAANGTSPEAMAAHDAFLKTKPGCPQGRLELKVSP